MLDAAERHSYLLEVARREGLLRIVSEDEASIWRREWKGALHASSLPRPALPRRPRRRHSGGRPLRSVAPAPALLEPGAWVAFQPHTTSRQEFLFQVIAHVPAGVALADVLAPDQLERLTARSILGPTPRYARVVLGVPGQWRAITAYRTTLAGSFAARARRLTLEEAAALLPAQDARSLSPLSPGCAVSWRWHSRHGESSLSGVVIAFVPAGVPLSTILPSKPASLHDVSHKDRYVVRDARGRLSTPAAHLVEPGALEGEAS